MTFCPRNRWQYSWLHRAIPFQSIRASQQSGKYQHNTNYQRFVHHGGKKKGLIRVKICRILSYCGKYRGFYCESAREKLENMTRLQTSIQFVHEKLCCPYVRNFNCCLIAAVLAVIHIFDQGHVRQL